MNFAQLATPCLLLERQRMERNITALKARLAPFGVAFRPHLKTAKSVAIAHRLMDSPQGPATVSTLAEAEAFAAAGITDLLYAVGIAPGKLARVQALRERGIDVTVLVDSVEQAQALAAGSGRAIPALIEIDSDGQRGGLHPDAPSLLEIGRLLSRCDALRGVLTHAGGSYGSRSTQELVAAAEQERAAAVRAADNLRAAGMTVPVVSVGSTPTAHFARDLSGVTEVRAGVFVFFDLVMAGIGVCAIEDIAVSVLASVIGHRAAHQEIIIDAGWMALSRDRGTAEQRVDQGFGLVCDVDGVPWPDLIVARTSQEHGVLAVRPGSRARLPSLPVGAQVRVLPNHACATAAQHAEYLVVENGAIVARWPRIAPGW